MAEQCLNHPQTGAILCIAAEMPEGVGVNSLDGLPVSTISESFLDRPRSSPLSSEIFPIALSGILLLVNTGFYQLVTLASDV
jgi:hypothetical protein